MFHIFTTPLSTPFGLFKAPIGWLADEMRWPAERYRKAFQEALGKGFIQYDEKHYVIFITNHLRYNPPANPNVLKGWAKIYAEIPRCELKNTFYQTLKGFVEDFHDTFQEAFMKAWTNGSPIQEQKQEHYQKKNKEQDEKQKWADHDPRGDQLKQFLENVSLTENEHRKLIDKYGVQNTHQAMMSLNSEIKLKGEFGEKCQTSNYQMIESILNSA